MGTADRSARIHAVAAKALMLEPRDTFTVPVTGSRDDADFAVEQIEDAIQDLYLGGVQLLPHLALREEITLRAVVTEASTHIVVERVERAGS